ncbi:MAG: hypothetical protein KF745_12455 [Phycisphaeraceae bacterium]|nr:hypothetical protein [Phycisphaeraceae bacterium]
MPSRLTIKPPADYVLKRDACSYGYFLLWPNNWSPTEQAFTRVLDVGGPVTARITQGTGSRRPGAGAPLTAEFSRTLTARQRAAAGGLITRMLRLDEDDGVVRAFHRLDPRWKKSGRGRLMRSPTLFEDVIKTVTSCNVTWPSTVNMNRRLCEVVGRGHADHGRAFPTFERLARTKPGTLRARCSVGYRDQRIVELARLFAAAEKSRSRRAGGLDLAMLEDPATADDAVFEALLELPGIGPYAAANVMQLMGRYARLPLDTESLRHAKTILGWSGTDRALMKRMHAHYAPFGVHAFRSYWFELWEFYEAKRGPAWTWERETTGKTFTAAQF